MTDHSSLLNRLYHHILIALFTLVVFALLFILRGIDDNRLTNWNWAFAGADVLSISLMLIFGLIASYGLSKLSFHERHPITFLMASSFIVCYSLWGEPEVIVDVSRYFTQAKHLKEYGINYFFSEWGRNINAWTDLPLLPFLYGLIFKFFGENRIYIQIFTAVLFSISIVSNYLLGKTLWNENVGFNGGILLLGMPYLLIQTPLMLVDIATMSFLTFSLYAFIMALKKGYAWTLISSAAIFLAVFSKYSTWMLLSVLGIAFLACVAKPAELGNPHRPKLRMTTAGLRLYCIKNASITALLACIFIGIVIFLKFELISEQITLLFTYQKPALKGWSESFISTFFYHIHPFITIAAVYSFYAAFKNKDVKYVIISWLVLLIIMLWIERIRYILPVFPMITLMAAYGFQAVRDKELRRFAVLSAVTYSIILALFVYLPFLQRMGSVNLMHAGKYIDTLESPAIKVFTIPPTTFSINPAVSVPILDFFTKKKIYYDYEKISAPEKVRSSPLRFTWSYKNPEYYKARNKHVADAKIPLIVITSENEEAMPEYIKRKVKTYKNTTKFNTTTGFFRYSPDVIIFLP